MPILSLYSWVHDKVSSTLVYSVYTISFLWFLFFIFFLNSKEDYQVDIPLWYLFFIVFISFIIIALAIVISCLAHRSIWLNILWSLIRFFRLRISFGLRKGIIGIFCISLCSGFLGFLIGCCRFIKRCFGEMRSRFCGRRLKPHLYSKNRIGIGWIVEMFWRLYEACVNL